MKADLLNTILILLAALLAVFWEGSFNLIRNLLGAQVDLLPGLMVYAGLYGSFAVVALLAVCGGLWFDSLSANPLGITVVPLFLCGLIIYLNRDLILRDQTFAQLVLGFSVSLVIPTMILLLLLTTGREPLVGWGTLWQFVVMGVGGALATPVWFELFGILNRLLGHHGASETSFRPDREIRRGRS